MGPIRARAAYEGAVGRWMSSACALVLAGCVGGVSDLEPGRSTRGDAAVGRPDDGIRPAPGLPRDAGFADPDAGAPDPDAGQPPIDAGTVDAGPPDAGLLATCPTGDTALVTTTAARGLEGHALARVGDRLALTWTDFDEEWVPSGHLRVFDLAGRPVGPARAIPPQSRVAALGAGFVLGGDGGLEWLDADGRSLGPASARPFLPLAEVDGMVWGRVRTGTASQAVGLFVPGVGLVRELRLELPLDVGLAFGPNRLVVVEPDFEGSTITVYDTDRTLPAVLARHRLPGFEAEGEPWRPGALAAGIWWPDGGAFELLLEMNVSNGRFFGGQRHRLDDASLGPGRPLGGRLARINHTALPAAMAAGPSGVSLAWLDEYSQLGAQLVIDVGGAQQRIDLAGRKRSRPLMVEGPGGVLVVAPLHTPAASSWENELRLFCLR
jgi:hypothetical protein